MYNKLEETFSIDSSDLKMVGKNLIRPECILCNSFGELAISNWNGGVTVIRPDGKQKNIVGKRSSATPVGTNGFAIDKEGTFFLADLNEKAGGVWRLEKTGKMEPLITEIDGKRIPPTNFVGIDHEDRIWITVSTWCEPRAKAYRSNIANGFIIMIDGKGPRIVAEDIGYTNEAIVHPNNSSLYVNETFGRRTLRFPILDNGNLGKQETVTEYGHGTYPDGLAFDEAGNFWMTSVVSNRVICVDNRGHQKIIIEEYDPQQLDEIEAAFQDSHMSGEHLGSIKTKIMKSISSIAFGGPDRRICYLGNLLDDKIYAFNSPLAGAKPSHWHVPFW